MQFEVYRSNGGRFHWRLIGRDGVELAVSSAEFATADAARQSADAVRADTTTPAPE